MTRRDGRLLGLLVLASVALFLYPLALGRTHVAGDVLYSFQPWLTYAAQELQRGALPLWNPYSTCGEPFLANPQVMAFFPPAQLFWMFGFTSAWRLHLAGQEALLLIAAYLLARRSGRPGAALAGLAAAWGGFTVTLWEFPGALAAMPLVFLLLLLARPAAGRGSRGWIGVPFAVALLFFAGYTQFAYYAILAAGGLAAARRPKDLALYGGAVALGVLLALPQILPTWDVARASLRAGVDAAAARQFLLTPVFLAKFLLPDLHDKAFLPYRPAVFDGNLWPVSRAWLNTFTIGLPALVLAAAGLRRRTAAWAVLGAAAALLAMGVEPLFSLFRWGVPGARYMTHFSNAMLLSVAALVVLAAEGARTWPARKKPAAVWGGLLFLAAASVALFPAVRLALLSRLLGVAALTAPQDAMVRGAALKAAAVLAVFGAGMLFLRRKWVFVLSLALGDLWLFGRDVHPLFSTGFFHAPVPLAARLVGTDARLSVDPRAMRENAKPMDGATMEEGYQSLRQALYPNLSLPFRIPHTWAYEVFADARFAQARRGAAAGPLLDFLGARDVISVEEMAPPARLAARRPNALLYENPSALPRVTWAGTSRVFSDDKDRLAWMAAGWDPRREVLLEEGAPGAAAGPLEKLQWRESPGRLEAEGRSGGGWLVYSETDHPGWEAWVNGKRAVLERADHAFLAVELPTGDWRAVFLYRPRPILFGFAAAAGLWAALTAAGLLFLRTF